jgi:hypothetical protein
MALGGVFLRVLQFSSYNHFANPPHSFIHTPYKPKQPKQSLNNTLKIGCCRNTAWTDRMRKEEVLLRAKEEGNILHTLKIRKATWIGHIVAQGLTSKTRY